MRVANCQRAGWGSERRERRGREGGGRPEAGVACRCEVGEVKTTCRTMLLRPQPPPLQHWPAETVRRAAVLMAWPSDTALSPATFITLLLT